MVSKGRVTDNIYIERFWRSLKHEEIYLKKYCCVFQLRFYSKSKKTKPLQFFLPILDNFTCLESLIQIILFYSLALLRCIVYCIIKQIVTGLFCR